MIRSLARRGLGGVKGVCRRLLNFVEPPVTVLIYHRVATLASDPQLLAVTPEHFALQMRYLRDHFSVLRFEQDWRGVSEPSVVVTFDDGYADNFLEALPILEKVGVPATFFVTSGAVDSDQEFWWDELERLILEPGPLPDIGRAGGALTNRAVPTAAERLALYQAAHPEVRELPPARRVERLRQLRDWSGLGAAGRSTHRALTTAQLRGLVSSSWATVGAHGVTHTRLAILSPEEQRFEILDCKRRLEALCQKEIEVFSFPFGGRLDYNRTTLEICRQAGFKRVAANFPGQAHSWSDPLQIPRQLVRNWGLDPFKEELQRFIYPK